MKIALLALLMLTCGSALAQGTFGFKVFATGRNAVPPNGSLDIVTGTFTLSGNIFTGGAGFTDRSTAGGLLLAIRDGAGALIFATDRIEYQDDLGAPFGYAYAFWDERPLVQSQIDDLMAGNWYMVRSNDDYPNGELRGQIQLVPEPSTVALFGVGIAAAAFLKWKRARSLIREF